MAAHPKDTSTSETVENLLKSYAKRRELLKKSHYFGMSFPAIMPTRSAICHRQQSLEDENSETTQHFIISSKISPLPKSHSIAAPSPDRTRRKASAQFKPLKHEKPTELDLELDPPNEPKPKTCKPTITNFIMIVTNIDELNNIDRNQSYFNIQNITVYDVIFDQFIPHLITLANDCKHLQTLELHRCRVDSFQHLEEIAQLRNVHNILIGSSGNAITQLSCWYLFLVHRMSHLSLRNVNGVKVTPELCSLAAQKFGSCVQMLRLSRRRRQISDKQTLLQEIEAISEDENQRVNCRLICALNQMENVAIRDAASKFVQQIVTNSLESFKTNKHFHQIWPHYFSRAVIETIKTFNEGIDFKAFMGEKDPENDDE